MTLPVQPHSRSSPHLPQSTQFFLGGDAVHLKGFFDKSVNYDSLLVELRRRERTVGIQGTYWQAGSGVAVTRVRGLSELPPYPIHEKVVQSIARCFHVRVEGWWVNHYARGTDAKNMHRDGWGRDRGVNITIGASFGDGRTLRFEAASPDISPQNLDCLQEDGDVFAFGCTANRLYKHGIAPECSRGPRISIIIMGRAPVNWTASLRLNTHADVSSYYSPPREGANIGPPSNADKPSLGIRRRWGRETEEATTVTKASVPDVVQEGAASRRWQRRTSDGQLQPSEEAVQGQGACLVWLRDDLRLADNPALHDAAESDCTAIVPVFIHDEEDTNPWPIRGAALWWKAESLKAFDESLRAHCNSRLVIRRGKVCEELLKLANEVGASCLHFNRMVEPWYRERDLRVEANLKMHLTVRTFKAVLLQEPWQGSEVRLPMMQHAAPCAEHVSWAEVAPGKLELQVGRPEVLVPESSVTRLSIQDVIPIINADRLLSNPNPCAQLLTALGESADDDQDHRRQDPNHYRVYQDIERGVYSDAPRASVRGRTLAPPPLWPLSLQIVDLGYHHSAGRGFPRKDMPQCAEHMDAKDESDDWAAGMKKIWRPGEDTALQRLREFVDSIESHKRPHRHRGDQRNTSLLSPHLRFGEVSPRTCYFEAMRAPPHLRHGFLRRVLWRDLSYAELYRWPDMPTTSQRRAYEEETWSGSAVQLRRWQKGQTGFPLVDAAMRQLWHEGYINNYLRHVTAGFLIDYLDITWKEGFKWYDYTLVDSDAAINARLWQQGGHSGISQWNFVMHPVYAAKNADPDGSYVRRWVPELLGMPTEFIHRPWEAPCELMSLGIKLGISYPRRMVLDIDAARKLHLRGVLKVRKDHPEMVSADGTERLLLVDGCSVLLRTRNDIRQDTEELIVAQVPDGVLHQKKGRGNAQFRLGYWQELLDEDVARKSTVVHNVHTDTDIL